MCTEVTSLSLWGHRTWQRGLSQVCKAGHWFIGSDLPLGGVGGEKSLGLNLAALARDTCIRGASCALSRE